MNKLVPIYIKYIIKFETYKDVGHIQSSYIMAENENELNAIIYKLMEFDIFKNIEKEGVVMQTINEKIDKKDDNSRNNPECYIYWINRKYYNMKDEFRNFLLRNFESFEEYEICTIIRDSQTFS